METSAHDFPIVSRRLILATALAAPAAALASKLPSPQEPAVVYNFVDGWFLSNVENMKLKNQGLGTNAD